MILHVPCFFHLFEIPKDDVPPGSELEVHVAKTV
jgi:hypothetical protein